MSGMHSTFSSSVTGDNRHSYALLSALQQGSGTGNNAAGSSHSHRKDADAASVSSFGSSVSLLKGKFHNHASAASSSPGSKKSSSLVARQRAAEDPEAQTSKADSAFCASPVRNEL
ncbi:hypothetical protein ColTof4_12633 [Colletotrichum tofieldiae]|uniref:Uncharacterized protein n=1 Tax=Colletotrichum tofieldiae TaxID=708197 RepID=A0A166TQ29_9PEZI|nr:hypothetical protein CT0861_10024 [Colletotrichum tofieldiae]GKT59074.1 hypothetical protein ColTof3_06413 [Colletotrichum tofieldiae]GKT80210.1 hypothetical protein ColTof4_12633 [Colletotrichum tofieldiae]